MMFNKLDKRNLVVRINPYLRAMNRIDLMKLAQSGDIGSHSDKGMGTLSRTTNRRSTIMSRGKTS